MILRKYFTSVFPVILFFLFLSAASAQNIPSISFHEEDRHIFRQEFERISLQQISCSGDLITAICMDFLEAPYVAKTLEVQPEQLIVNLREFDCTTLVESCLALMRCLQKEDSSFEGFCRELLQIRYRQGHLDGYVSRLHYFSEWIKDNQQKGLLKDITQELRGETFDVELFFMSANPSSYPQLIQDSSLIRNIHETERQVSVLPFYYIPEQKIRDIEELICPGDILAITSTVPGLDIAHTGFAYRKNGRIYLLHASSLHKKVEITGQPLQEYLGEIKSMNGVMVLRPLHP